MSVPYETCGTHEAFESPDACLQRLLARTLNSFELPDETLSRLDTALAYDSCLHSAAHHSDGRRRETYRHVWLVADGSAVTLWELTHNTGPDGQLHHEVYTDQEELRIATARLPLPSAEPEALEGTPPLVVDDRTAQPLPGREYEWGDSPDHARRVLRRAENADRPGRTTQWVDQPLDKGDFAPLALRTEDGGAMVLFATRHFEKQTAARGVPLSVRPEVGGRSPRTLLR